MNYESGGRVGVFKRNRRISNRKAILVFATFGALENQGVVLVFHQFRAGSR
jgi:hypothetical protein